MFNIIKFCEDKKNCNYAGYNKLVTSTNNPKQSERMRYAQYVRKFN